MDLKKIGIYIAKKRKDLGLTQVELARQLGMSDKSVSKWERGICLPDVSMYEPLCKILDISINEFIAGEDLDGFDAYVQQSEKNLLDVATEANVKFNKMQNGLICLILIYFFITCWLTMVQVYPSSLDYIESIGNDTKEMIIAEVLCDEDNVFGYSYNIQNKCEKITFQITEYRDDEVLCSHYTAEIPNAIYVRNGLLVIGFDPDAQTIHIDLIDENVHENLTIPIDEILNTTGQMIRVSNISFEKRNIYTSGKINLLSMILDNQEQSYLLSVAFKNS